MYPHERSLVKKMEGKPFVLLGVNSDQSPLVAKQAVISEKLTWRSWYGGQGGGAIAQAYHIQGWPTLFLIDHKGVIRQKWLGAQNGDALDQAIGTLVKEAKADIVEKAPPKSFGEKTETGSRSEPPRPAPSDPEKLAATKFGFAKQLAEDGNTDKAKERCRQLIKDYPKTKAARQAQDLLDKLSK